MSKRLVVPPTFLLRRAQPYIRPPWFHSIPRQGPAGDRFEVAPAQSRWSVALFLRAANRSEFADSGSRECKQSKQRPRTREPHTTALFFSLFYSLQFAVK